MSNKIELIPGRVYKLTSSQTDDVYIGSTTKSLNERLMKHKYAYDQWVSTSSGYLSSFEILKYDDCAISLICEFPIKERDELRFFEQYYIDTTNNCINKNNALGDKKEYDRKYYQEHRDSINARQSQQIQCECGATVSRRNIAKHRKTSKHIRDTPLIDSTPTNQQDSHVSPPVTINIMNSNVTINNN